MEKRHLIYSVIFLCVFAFGSLNVVTDGRFSHVVASRLPGHAAEASATPDIQISNNLTTPSSGGGTVEAVIQNADEVSYTIYNSSSDLDMNMDFRPHPDGGEDSLPPSWLWDHPEKKISLEIHFNSSNASSGKYIYSLEAENSGSEASKQNFSVAVR